MCYRIIFRKLSSVKCPFIKCFWIIISDLDTKSKSQKMITSVAVILSLIVRKWKKKVLNKAITKIFSRVIIVLEPTISTACEYVAIEDDPVFSVCGISGDTIKVVCQYHNSKTYNNKIFLFVFFWFFLVYDAKIVFHRA